MATQLISLTLVLVSGLLALCSGSAVQRNAELKSAGRRKPKPAAEARRKECDFSAYAPVRIKHFTPEAATNRVKPEYPPEAARRGIQGRVVVKTLVNEDGIIERACAVAGEESLQSAAEAAALQWRLKPGYGFGFSRPDVSDSPKKYAEVYIVFDFKIGETGSKAAAMARP